MEKKIGKYLLYAIGIFVLMIINSLINLSIINWNEARKEAMKEAQKENKETGALIENIELNNEISNPFTKETNE